MGEARRRRLAGVIGQRRAASAHADAQQTVKLRELLEARNAAWDAIDAHLYNCSECAQRGRVECGGAIGCDEVQRLERVAADAEERVNAWRAESAARRGTAARRVDFYGSEFR